MATQYKRLKDGVPVAHRYVCCLLMERRKFNIVHLRVWNAEKWKDERGLLEWSAWIPELNFSSGSVLKSPAADWKWLPQFNVSYPNAGRSFSTCWSFRLSCHNSSEAFWCTNCRVCAPALTEINTLKKKRKQIPTAKWAPQHRQKHNSQSITFTAASGTCLS